MTKYKRALYADQYKHQYFDSVEIGKRLARTHIKQLDPFRSYGKPIESTCLPGTVYVYKNPKLEHFKLLENYNYLTIRKPGVRQAYEAQKLKADYVNNIFLI